MNKEQQERAITSIQKLVQAVIVYTLEENETNAAALEEASYEHAKLLNTLVTEGHLP